MYLCECLFVASTEEMNTDKRIGFFKGLRETIGFKPYLLLLLMEMFSWLAVQVSGLFNRCVYALHLHVYKCIHTTVCSR